MMRRDFLKISGLVTVAVAVNPAQALEVFPAGNTVSTWYIYYLGWCEGSDEQLHDHRDQKRQLVLYRNVIDAPTLQAAEDLTEAQLRARRNNRSAIDPFGGYRLMRSAPRDSVYI